MAPLQFSFFSKDWLDGNAMIWQPPNHGIFLAIVKNMKPDTVVENHVIAKPGLDRGDLLFTVVSRNESGTVRPEQRFLH
jgi:hypothetical protein